MEEAEAIVVGLSSLFTAVQWNNSSIFHNVVGKVLASTDWMALDLGHKVSDIRDHINNPLGIGSLLSYPFEYVEILESITDLLEICSITDLEWGIKGLVIISR